MKTIGIKLADGSFYPILEEGEAKTRQLDLTTVKDGQTKVQIDLYRSESGTMEDAEYVDTLEVSNLVSHPNGEVSLHLSVGLNENNELDANVIDEETGKQSSINVSLISRTLAERNEPSNFELTEQDDSDSNTVAAAIAGGVAGAIAATALNGTEEESTSLEDFSFDDFEEQQTSSEPQETLSVTTPEDIEDVPFSFDSEIDYATESEISNNEENSSDTTFEELEDITVADEKSEDLPSIEDLNISNEDMFDTSSFTTDPIENIVNEQEVLESMEDITSQTEEPISTSESEESFSTSDFDLPDFDSTNITESTDYSNNTETTGLTGYFDDPDFKDNPVFTETNLDTDSEIEFDTSDLDNSFSTEVNNPPAMDFSDLYDEESLETDNNENLEEEVSKKTRVPVIVCIICAIICVIATILILFVVPSKYNLLKSRNTKTEVTEEFVLDVTPAETPTEITEEPIPEAKENTIVVAPESEVIVPVPTPEPTESKDVKYRIKWGDTLWDISDAYYKNPWRYPKIAKYNKISNPDLIISGTDILIPVE